MAKGTARLPRSPFYGRAYSAEGALRDVCSSEPDGWGIAPQPPVFCSVHLDWLTGASWDTTRPLSAALGAKGQPRGCQGLTQHPASVWGPGDHRGLWGVKCRAGTLVLGWDGQGGSLLGAGAGEGDRVPALASSSFLGGLG